jgi:acetolactate synthase-1/2/3 large subunit
VSEIGDALTALAQECRTPAPPAGAGRLRQLILAELNAHVQDDAMPMKPQRILADMHRVLTAEDLVISDVGAHKLWIARMFMAKRPNSVVISNGFATMGIGVPGGVAAKLAEPQRRIVVVTGDGGFMMNVQELETARRLKTPFVTLVWVDDAYGVIRWKQERSFGRSFGVEFGNPDFAALAAAFGLPGFSVTRAEDFAPTLERALALDEPSVIAVPIDYGENRRLTETLGEIEMLI